MSKEKKGFLGLGKLFKTIKRKIMADFITKFLASIYEKFKAANPKIAAAVAVIALGLQFGFEVPIETALAGVGLVIDLPAEFLSLDYILNFFKFAINDTLTDVLMMVLALLSGSKSTEFLDPKTAEEKLKKSQIRLAERTAKREAKQAAKNGGSTL